MGGGKFANGAVTAAFGYAFNELSHREIIAATIDVETLYSGRDESFDAFTERLSGALVRNTEKTGYEYVSALSYRDDDSFIEKSSTLE